MTALPTQHSLCFIFLAALLATIADAGAFTIEHSATSYVDRQYQFELIATLDAPIQRVEAVLRDYAGYPSLDRRILESRVLERPADQEAVLATTLRACFGPFCRNVKRVERVEERLHEMRATTLTERSEGTLGETHTLLTPAGDGTRVTYRTRIAPGFWVPAIVGRRWMLNTLADATTDLFRNVEVKAQSLSE